MLKKSRRNQQEEESTFWDHLEVLRWSILRIIFVLLTLMFLGFGFKDFIFNSIILPPLSSDFYTYQLLCKLSETLKIPALCLDSFEIELININLTGQFMVHMSTALSIGFLLSFPYIVYEAWIFIKPALYPKEKKSIGMIFFSSSFLFYLGVSISYFIVFPLSIRFLGLYQVSDLVINQISITSYMNTLVLISLFMGIAFELPVVIYLLSTIGIVNKTFLRASRKYVLLIVVFLAAIITPTTDPFTLTIVALPIYLLYELSIFVCKKEVTQIAKT